MDSADNAPADAMTGDAHVAADVAADTRTVADVTTESAWHRLLTHQRDRTGFCRVCRDHWPCEGNAAALRALAVTEQRGQDAPDSDPAPQAHPGRRT